MTDNNPIVTYQLGIFKNSNKGKAFIKIDDIISAQ